jgi:hypothetical protein
MFNRIIFSTVVSAFVASIAFGQMKYSRPRSASPTPTPTPAQLIPAQETPPAPPSPKPTAAPRIIATPTPARPTPVPRITQAPMQTKMMPTTPAAGQAKPTPLPRTMSMQSPTPSQRMTSTTIQARPAATPVPVVVKPTPTPVPPPDVKAYLDRQVASSKDQKFHMTINGKDLPMTPFHVWRQKEAGPNMTSTCVDMRGDDGRVYDIDFVTMGAQVSGIRIHKINGETLR